jgi:hypothetical protein
MWESVMIDKIKEIAAENEFSGIAVKQAEMVLSAYKSNTKIADTREDFYRLGFGKVAVDKSFDLYHCRAAGLAIMEELIPTMWETQLSFK